MVKVRVSPFMLELFSYFKITIMLFYANSLIGLRVYYCPYTNDCSVFFSTAKFTKI